MTTKRLLYIIALSHNVTTQTRHSNTGLKEKVDEFVNGSQKGVQKRSVLCLLKRANVQSPEEFVHSIRRGDQGYVFFDEFWTVLSSRLVSAQLLRTYMYKDVHGSSHL